MKRHNSAALLVVGLAATACSGGTTAEPSGPNLDARSYVDNYDDPDRWESSAGHDAAVGAPEGGVAPLTDEPVEVMPPRPPEVTGNIHRDEGPSIWVDAATSATSTFALDVDTGSFSFARSSVEQGYLPHPDSIRVEEWVNSFDYGDPDPAGTDLGLTVESALAPRAGEDTAVVRVGVSTAQLSADERPDAHITFVIDTSGSMDSGNRLGLVQSSLALLANNLRPEDTIAIVTYGTDAAPLLPPTPVSEVDSIIAAIEELTPGGSTNMEAGLDLGYRQARQSYQEDGVNVVVLASDGVANVGATDPEVLNEITEAGQDGITLVTVGYGMGNYNDLLMEQLANTGNGFYSYIDTFEEAERLFVDELTPTLTVVAYDAKAQVSFDADAVSRYRLIGYQNRALDDEDFVDDSVDAGELGAGHSVTALYEIEPTGALAPGTPLGQVSLRWAGEPGAEATQLDGELLWPDDTSSDAMQLATLVADTAEVLKGTEIAAERRLDLESLSRTAAALVEREVPGAVEAHQFIQSAQQVSTTGRHQD